MEKSGLVASKSTSLEISMVLLVWPSRAQPNLGSIPMQTGKALEVHVRAAVPRDDLLLLVVLKLADCGSLVELIASL